MSEIKFVYWEELFSRVVDETDPEKLALLVPQAELAMSQRELELRCCSQPNEELSTICVASQALRVIKRGITQPESVRKPKGNGTRFASFVRRLGAE